MKRVLFQGDSITDCGRNGSDFYDVGKGYPYLAKADFEFEHGRDFEIINRGVSGNRIVDLIARIKFDIINLKPDYISILIGVNDVWHEIAFENGVDTADFEFYYDRLITIIKEKLPNIKIAIIEPFVLEGPATCNTEEIPDKFERFKKDVAEKAAVAKKIAEKHSLAFIPLQEEKSAAAGKIGLDMITRDGVHPNVTGHLVSKNQWMKWFNSNI